MWRKRLPRASYGVPALSIIILHTVRWMLEQYFSGAPEWQELPWGWLTGMALAFWAGLVVQDLYNQESWIWHNLCEFRKVFVVESVVPAHKLENNQEWLRLTANIRFVKRCKSAKLIIRIHSAINNRNANDQFVLDARTIDVEKDHQEKLVFGIVPIKAYEGNPPGYQCWGSRFRPSGDVDGMKSLFSGTDNIVSIELRTWRGVQKLPIFVHLLNKESGEMGRVFMEYQRDVVAVSVTPSPLE